MQTNLQFVWVNWLCKIKLANLRFVQHTIEQPGQLKPTNFVFKFFFQFNSQTKQSNK